MEPIYAVKESEKKVKSLSHVLPTWFLCPWDFPGKDTGVGSHALLQGIFPTQGVKPRSPAL